MIFMKLVILVIFYAKLCVMEALAANGTILQPGRQRPAPVHFLRLFLSVPSTTSASLLAAPSTRSSRSRLDAVPISVWRMLRQA